MIINLFPSSLLLTLSVPHLAPSMTSPGLTSSTVEGVVTLRHSKLPTYLTKEAKLFAVLIFSNIILPPEHWREPHKALLCKKEKNIIKSHCIHVQ